MSDRDAAAAALQGAKFIDGVTPQAEALAAAVAAERAKRPARTPKPVDAAIVEQLRKGPQ